MDKRTKEQEAFNWLMQAPTQVDTLLEQDLISCAEVYKMVADYEARGDTEMASSQLETIEVAKSIIKLSKLFESLGYKL